MQGVFNTNSSAFFATSAVIFQTHSGATTKDPLSRALYAKIPAMTWPILGHTWAADLLAKHISSGGVRHAYLFCGPPGVGRRTLAKQFVQALNCLQPPVPGEACGVCRLCEQTAREQQPDLHIIQMAEEASTIKVEQIRELQRVLSLSPYQARYRVALLTGFERATPGAQNALLKTLEEAPEKVILLLTADSPDNLLPTIVSRCEVLRLRPMAVDGLTEALETTCQLSQADASLYAHIAGGRPGLALSLARDEKSRDLRDTWIKRLNAALSGGIIERFSMADALSRDKNQLRAGLRIWLTYWRDMMLASSGARATLTNLDQAEALQQAARQIDFSTASRCVAALEEALAGIDLNLNPRLLLEVTLLDWPTINSDGSPAILPVE